MDLRSSTKPVVFGSHMMPRADITASFRAVRTEIPPEAAVQQVAPVEPVRFELNEALGRLAAVDAAFRTVLKRETVIDPETKALVTRKVDEDTGEVVAQTPDEAVLRLRAYLRELGRPIPVDGQAGLSKSV